MAVNYIYYGYITIEQFKELENSKITMSINNTAEVEKEKRRVQKASDIVLNALTIALNISATGLPKGPHLDNQVFKVVQNMKAIESKRLSNPKNVFYTGTAECGIDVEANCLDLKNVVAFENGAVSNTPILTHLLPPSRAVARAESMQASPKIVSPPIMCYFVSPTPPDVVYQNGKLTHGVMTCYAEDAEELAKSGRLPWPKAALQTSQSAPTIRDAFKRVPRELTILLNPKKFGIDNSELQDAFVDVNNAYQDLVERMTKVENQHILKKMFRNLMAQIPLVNTNPYNKRDIEAARVYETKLDRYREKFQHTIDQKINAEQQEINANDKKAQAVIFNDLVNSTLNGNNLYDKTMNLSDDIILRLNLDEIFTLNKNNFQLQKEFIELKKKIFVNQYLVNGAPEIKQNILDFILHLQNTTQFSDLPKLNNLLERNLRHAIKNAEKIAHLPVQKLEHFSIFTHELPHGKPKSEDDSDREDPRPSHK